MDRLARKRHRIADALQRIGSNEGLFAVGDVMTPSPSTIAPETTVRELVRLFHSKGFRHLLVVSASERLLGVISDRDVVRCFGPGVQVDPTALDTITAADIMSTDLITVGPQATVEQAAGLMFDYGINCLPVLDRNVLLGIVTTTDMYIVLQLLLKSPRQSVLSEPLPASVNLA